MFCTVQKVLAFLIHVCYIHTSVKNMMKGDGLMPGGKHILGQGKNRVFGTAKVGDRGQIVIPQEARRFFGISPGDTLLILGNESSGLVVTRPEVLNDLADEILGKEETER